MKIKNYPQLRLLSREMRSEGASLPEIVAVVCVPRNTVYYWIRDILLSDEQNKVIAAKKKAGGMHGHMKASEALKSKYAKNRENFRSIGREEAKGSLLHAMGCMLFWAEGSKKRNTVIFTNTDSSMIEIFHRFLLEEMKVDAAKIRYDCTVHDDPGNLCKDECASIWASSLGVEKSRINVSLSKDKRKLKRRYNKHSAGIFVISYHDVKVAQRIFGAIEGYAGKRLTIAI